MVLGRPENNMAFLAAAEKFLAKHLGGRYQEEIPENIAKRLEEITVDINAVTLPEKVDANKLSSALPTPISDLTAGTSKYKMTIKMGTQEIPMDLTQTVEEKDGNWMVTQSAQSPMGAIKDVGVITKGSLVPVSRMVEQGPVKIDIAHGTKKITGTMSMNETDQPIDVTLENPVFADGAALNETLARLPLKEGYSTVYRTLDLQAQKVKSYELKVVAIETVEVPAGAIEAYKTEVKALGDTPGDTVLWFAKDPAKPGLVKSTASLPNMGGATMILELSEK